MAKLIYTINTKKGKEFEVQRKLLEKAEEVHPLFSEFDFVIMIEGKEDDAANIGKGLKRIDGVTKVSQLEVKGVF